MPIERQTVKAHCGRCNAERNCYIRADGTNVEFLGGLRRDFNYRLMSCAGCDYIFCMCVITHPKEYGSFDDETGEFHSAGQEFIYFPGIVRQPRPEWLTRLTFFVGEDDNHDRLRSVLEQIYIALDNELHVLAAIGIRAAFEILVNIFGVDEQLTFPQKIDWLKSHKITVEEHVSPEPQLSPQERPVIHIKERGILGEQESEAFKTLVEVGNAAAHRGWEPGAEVLATLMKLLESTIYREMLEPFDQSWHYHDVDEYKSLIPRRALSRKRDTKARKSKTPPPEK
ncbi:hypothetical protein [Acetobacter sp.]|jgi:hypothetical protein|uniref:hypothetical protein n=1 Tax=Acetobacter sp. TaxID=440 RepID=UPI0025C26360|nr:hypothetical protein [Acetobacter sp.]MCH4091454.1 DUF4145 domain-containing protein [Acetobacter sp.]MCI1299432.1 DUF4145 domain-containing protein [Acetobacter sp.]MCI1316978.1 DUF4145 domain-containing protein [Acetobacter sp.]